MKITTFHFATIATFCIFFLFCGNGHAQVEWTGSTVSKTWSAKSAALIVYNNEPIDATILLNEKQQVIDGFGACFNELGWTALSVLEDTEREAILKNLFDPQEGLKLNICRMPIGANDYARDYYSLNDSAGDFEMKYFTIARDKEVLIPYIKAAMKYRPDLGYGDLPGCHHTG